MVISVQGLAKTFKVGLRGRPVEAVREVSLEVEAGEVLGFVGPNGAGKSTTIHMLLGLVRPTRGTGTVLGEPLGSLNSRRRIGYLPELPNFYSYLRAGELLMLSGRLAGLSAAQLQGEIPALLEQVGLPGHADSPMRTFSKGMLQRVGLAQALLGTPELVILDEPMSGLDPLGRHIVIRVIRQLRERGTTVFFSSHVMPDIEALCDRVVLVAHGRSLRTATVAELLDVGDAGFELLARCPEGQLPDALPGLLAVAHSGALLRLELDGQAAVQAAIDWVRSHGEVVSLSPLRDSLEEVVVRELEKSGGPS